MIISEAQACFSTRTEGPSHQRRLQPSNRTYIGITNNIDRRIKQHNGTISGGAKYTSSYRPWKLYGYVRGFGEDKSLVLKFEWRWKYLSRKEKGTSVDKRIKALSKTLVLSSFTGLEFVNLQV